MAKRSEVQLDFDEDVTVLGKPAIRLGISFGSGRHNGMTSASYVRGSGTDKLVFSLRVSSHPIYHSAQLAVTKDATSNCSTATGVQLYHARSSGGIRKESDSSNIDDFVVNCGILSPSTHRIDGRNSPATGRPTISGRVEESSFGGRFFRVSIDGIADANGVPSKNTRPGFYGWDNYGPDGFADLFQNYHLTWQRVDADGFSNPTEVWNPVTTYKMTPADNGKRIRVRVWFIDNKGSAEEVVSEATPIVASGGVVPSFCDRTPEVVAAILSAILLTASWVNDCAKVTYTHLGRIRTLSLYTAVSTQLKAGDFEGLTKVRSLGLGGIGLTVLPTGIFDKLESLTDLNLAGNWQLTAMPAGIFDKLESLGSLSLAALALTTLPDNIFEQLTNMHSLLLVANPGVATFLPVANAGTDVTARTNSTATLSGSATGPWGNNVRFLWRQVTDEAGATTSTSDRVTLLSHTTATPNFTVPSTAGTLFFRLTVTGKGTTDATDTDVVKVTVSSGQVAAPSVTGVTILPEFGNGSWGEGETVEVALTFDEAVTVDTTGGTPTVALTLGASTAKTAAYVRGSGTAELVFGYTLAKGEGPYDSAQLALNSLALNGGAIRSTASGADAALAHDGFAVIGGPTMRGDTDPGPTARFSALPQRHDGESAFDIELHFSAAPEGLSYRTVAGGLLAVTGGTVEKARRKTTGSNIAWVVTIRPSGPGDIAIRLPARACGEANAVCFDNRPLAEDATATVPGVPFTASFAGAPAEHDGERAFTVNFHLSLAPATLSSYRTVRDSLFDVTGGRIVKARRLTPRKNQNWELTVAPGGLADVTLRLRPTTSCSALPGVCDAAGRMLAGGLSTTVRGPVTLSVADAEGGGRHRRDYRLRGEPEPGGIGRGDGGLRHRRRHRDGGRGL